MMCLACKCAQLHNLSHTVKNQLMLSKMPLPLEPLLVAKGSVPLYISSLLLSLMLSKYTWTAPPYLFTMSA